MKPKNEIVLCVQIPECKACRDQIESLLMSMGCWKEICFGYPTLSGSAVTLVCRDDCEGIDFYDRAREAKRILRGYYYLVV